MQFPVRCGSSSRPGDPGNVSQSKEQEKRVTTLVNIYLHRAGGVVYMSVGIDGVGTGHRRLFSSLPGWHTGLG